MMSVLQVLLSTVILDSCKCARRDESSTCSYVSDISYHPAENTSTNAGHAGSNVARRFRAVVEAIKMQVSSKAPKPREPTYTLREVSDVNASFMADLIEHEKNGFITWFSRDQKVTCSQDYSHLQTETLYVNEGFDAQPDGEDTKTYYRFYHGTSPSGVENIIQNGFKVRKSKFWGTYDGDNLLGAGLYLSSTVLKADQYSVPVNGSHPSSFPMLLVGIDKDVFDNRVFVYLWHGTRRNEFFALIHGERVLHHGRSKVLKHLRKQYKGKMIQILAARNHEALYNDTERELANDNSLPETLRQPWAPVIKVFDEFVFTPKLIERILVDRTLRLEYVLYYNRCERTKTSEEGCTALTCGS
eukprot:TRINITY_DN6056_c0_g1_i1.p1 TRINITY_DN6056_c0_g1~~TRINITY_DN6056_c0_g1_i1.p1  ORF type:complete len:358 (+),score=35.71 TRINITY_DN6056_c0_g1_i1:75-1148(+)